MEKLQYHHRTAPLQTASIDLSKPRLVQITLSDIGACMPLGQVAPLVSLSSLCLCIELRRSTVGYDYDFMVIVNCFILF